MKTLTVATASLLLVLPVALHTFVFSRWQWQRSSKMPFIPPAIVLTASKMV